MKPYKQLLNEEIERRIEEIQNLLEDATIDTDKRVLNMERGRLETELEKRRTLTEGFPNPLKIPHVFFNTALTKPATKELADYLLRALEEHPEALRYLHTKSQQYVKHGSGVPKMTYNKWKVKLKTDMRRQKWE